jgi:GNAT superfamily N-acetyltransferase
MFSIREGEVKDSREIAILLTELGYPSTAAFAADKIQQQLAHPDARLLVAVDAGHVLGFVSLHFMVQLALPGEFCRISYFCVGQQWRRQGVGDALERTVQTIARDRECDRIEVHCHERRTAAHQFYGNQGYSESPQYLMKSID